MQLSNRTLAMVAVIAVALLMIVNPQWLSYSLGIIQSIVVIVLGILATAYLWKRM